MTKVKAKGLLWPKEFLHILTNKIWAESKPGLPVKQKGPESIGPFL